MIRRTKTYSGTLTEQVCEREIINRRVSRKAATEGNGAKLVRNQNGAKEFVSVD